MGDETIRTSMRKLINDNNASSDVRQLAAQILRWRMRARPERSGETNGLATTGPLSSERRSTPSSAT
jgi:hypothetical protein